MTAAVCGPSVTREVTREELHRPDQWCFRCRGRHDFMWRVYAVPTEQVKAILHSGNPYAAVWCDPYARIECSHCGQRDGDLFPGWTREWEDE